MNKDSNDANAALAEPWRRLWNGDLGQLDAIVAEDFVTHAALMAGTGDDILRGRGALGEWIRGMHAMMASLLFTVEVGPITNADHLVIRWRVRGTYRGGLPGAPDTAIGREISFTGTDILRVVEGMLAEYWVNSDTLLLMQQLGIGAAAPSAQ